MWIRNIESGEMINISDCTRILKDVWHRANNSSCYYIKFYQGKQYSDIEFEEDEKGRNNFYDHIQNLIKPIDIDSQKKPITL